MKLNEKITDKFDVIVNKARTDIITAIEAKKKEYEWTGFLLADTIYYREIKIEDGQLRIVRHPTPISPFRPFGGITIDIEELDETQTRLFHFAV